MSKKNLKSGEKAPFSGQYLEKGPRGGAKKEITISKGKVLPPSKKGGNFLLVDKTKNKGNK